MQKKLLSVLLVLCMLLSMFPMTLPAAAAVEEPADIVEIADVEGFLAVMNDPTAWAGSYKLTDDIDLTDLPQTPIGNGTTAFTGYFDGNGKTISGINISGSVAGTGELSLRGKVLAIGGLKEKTMAAYTCGVKNVLIPFDNEKDLTKIDIEAKENLNIIPCKTVKDVLDNALVNTAIKTTAKNKTIDKKHTSRNNSTEKQIRTSFGGK